MREQLAAVDTRNTVKYHIALEPQRLSILLEIQLFRSGRYVGH